MVKLLNEKYFADYDTRSNDSLKRAKDAAIMYCCDMASADVEPYWLVFLGESGTGKTMLMKAVNRFFQRNMTHLEDHRNRPGELYYRRGGVKPWINVVNEMMGGDFSGIRSLREDWWVCLDDIGVEYMKHRDLAVSKLFEIFSAREKLFTGVTANLGLDEIGEKMDVRISSRLLRHGSVVVEFEAEDFNR